MIKEAIEHILQLADGSVFADKHGRVYSTGNVESLPSPESVPPTFEVSTLDGLVGYLAGEIDAQGHQVDAVQVTGPETVLAVTSVMGPFAQRFALATACPFLPKREFLYDQYMKLEDFITGINAHFVQDESTKTILEIVGNIVDEEEIITEDDGFSQSVVARAGIAGRQRLSVPNPIMLRPYRTFPEIEQPRSPFVVRVSKSSSGPSAALFSAGDAGWKVAAVESIKKYLTDAQDIQVIG